MLRSRVNAGLMDLTTGEILEGLPLLVPQRHRNAFSEGWVAMSQPGFENIAREIKSVEQFRVLSFLISRLDFNNFLTINQSEIASELTMAQPSVNRAIKALVEKGILLEGQRMGRIKSYKLNPNYGWKGKAQAHVVALSEVRSAKRLAQAAKDKATSALATPQAAAVGTPTLAWDSGDVPGQMDFNFPAKD